MILSALINLRIIVPALQIIHPALCIEVVPSVAERVLLSYGRRHRAGNVYGPAPAVVFIIYNPLSGTVNQPDDVILGVSYVVVTGGSDNHCNQVCRPHCSRNRQSKRIFTIRFAACLTRLNPLYVIRVGQSYPLYL